MKEYTGVSSKVYVEFSTLQRVYTNLVDQMLSEDEIRKYLIDFNNDCDRKVTINSAKLNDEYKHEMERLETEFTVREHIHPPTISVETITSRAKEKAYKTITIPGSKKQQAAWGAGGGAIIGALQGFVVAGPVGAIVGALAGGALGAASGAIDGEPDRYERHLDEAKYIRELGSVPQFP